MAAIRAKTPAPTFARVTRAELRDHPKEKTMNSDASRVRNTTTHTHRRRWVAPIALLVGSALIAAAGSAAGFWGPRHGDHGHRFDGEKVRFGVEWMLRGTDASDEQVEAIAAIAGSAHADLRGIADRHLDNRAAFVAAFTADEIDPAAIEALRLEAVAMAEEGSTRIAAALTAAARELSPEQRRELAERHEHFHRAHHQDRAEE
jgi:protein CpxP